MSLVATRQSIDYFPATPQPSDFCIGSGGVVIVSQYWDHPTRSEISLLLYQSRTTINDRGWEISSEIEEWSYDTAQCGPTLHRKRVWAFVRLPGVNWHPTLTLVQDEQTVYRYDVGFPMPRPTKETTVSGYVIYDLTPTVWATDKGKPKLDEEGRKIPASTDHREIINSARTWESATAQSAIVAKADAPQISHWQIIRFVSELVKEDYQRVISWTKTHDYLTGTITVDGPHEENKAPLRIEMPVQLTAPVLSATAAGAGGVLVEISGGDGEIKTVWPEEAVQRIRVESYAIYRRTTVQPARTPTGDPYGLFVTPPTAGPDVVPLQITAALDFAGAPADPLPPQTSYSEDEDNSVPPVETWDMLAEVDNAETTKGAPGRAVWSDTDVEDGATYEYFTVARVGNTESPESNHVTLAYSGPLTFTSGITVRVKGAAIDIEMPPKTVGETVVMEVPASLDTDLQQLGEDIGLRQAVKDTPGLTATLVPTFPVFMIERGNLCTVPEISWKTAGYDLQLSTKLASRKWSIEGWETVAERSADGGWSFGTTSIALAEVK